MTPARATAYLGRMTMPWRPISPYQALSAAERSWCDAVVHEIEGCAARANMPLALFLQTDFTIPAHITARDTKGMMTRRDVQYAITDRLQENARNNDLTQQRWAKELMAIAFSNLDNYIDRSRNPPAYDFTRCTPEQMAAVESIKIKKGNKTYELSFAEAQDMAIDNPAGEVEIKLHSKLVALKMLGEYAGFIATDNPLMRADRQTAPVRTTDTVESAGERYAALLEGR